MTARSFESWARPGRPKDDGTQGHIQQPRKEAAIMRTIILAGAGALLTLAGVIVTLQGVGVIGGSAMSGVTFWAVAGPVIAVAGLAIAVASLRRRLASQG